MGARLSQALRHVADAVFVVFCALLLTFAVFGTHDHGTLYTTVGQAAEAIVMLACAGLLMLALLAGSRLIDALSDRGTQACAAVLHVAIALAMALWLCCFRPLPTTDTATASYAAHWLATHVGQPFGFQGAALRYFSTYSNNNLFVIVLSWVYRAFGACGLENDLLPSQVVNAGVVLLGLHLAYRCMRILKGAKAATKLLFLFLLNPLTYGYATWVYTLTFSLPLITGIMWLGLLAARARSRLAAACLAAACGLCGAVSFHLRPTSLIALVALALLAAISLLSDRGLAGRVALLSVSCLVVMAVSSVALQRVCDGLTSPEMRSRNFPVAHWLMMGSHGSGTFNVEDHDLCEQIEDPDERSRVMWEMTADHYRELGVSGTLQLFARKANLTFCDGFADIGGRVAEDTLFSPLYQYVSGDRNGAFVIYCQAFRVLTLALMLVAAVRRPPASAGGASAHLAPFVFMGGVVFYLVWEAKDVYSFPFLPAMLMCCQDGVDVVAEGVRRRRADLAGHARLRASALSALAILALGTAFYAPVCEEPLVRKDYAIRQFNTFFSVAFEGPTAGEPLVQELPGGLPFNRIHIRMGAQAEGDTLARYRATVVDGRGEAIGSRDFDALGLGDSTWLLIEPRHEEPSEEPLRLVVELVEEGERGIDFLHRVQSPYDRIPGRCLDGGEEVPYDMGLNVWNEYDAPLLAPSLYRLLVGGAAAAAFLLTLCVLGGDGRRAHRRDVTPLPRHATS